MDTSEALDVVSKSLRQCFPDRYYEDTRILPRSGNILVASWRWARVDYKPRRWELSIRFPGNLIARFCKLNNVDQARIELPPEFRLPRDGV